MNLPVELISSLEGLPGFSREAFEAVHAGGPAVTSIRMNPAKMAEWAGAERVPWSSAGRYLPSRPSFTFDPLFHAGAYYVQEASSMFLEQALRQNADLTRPLRVLDLCAAPGGKSTLLQSLLSEESLLVSNEVIRNRVSVLDENISKWGAAAVVITRADPQDLGKLVNYFDVIVVDAPCSGSGLFRRDPEAAAEWSPENVRHCHQRQRRILADCWPALRREGLLIYSTCSYSREENEDILDWMMDNMGASNCRLTVPEEWKIVETMGRRSGYGYRFYPDRLRGEGFFLTCMRKGDGGAYVPPRKTGQLDRPAKRDEALISHWVNPGRDLAYFQHGDLIHGIPSGLLAEVPVLRSACYLRRAGVPMGKLAVKEFVPAHDLALSAVISRQLPALSLTWENAVRYLRKDELAVDPPQRGWVLVQYEGLNIGWIKVLPGRINNYYPKEWRILRREP